MAIPTNRLSALRLLMQTEGNLIGLQRDMNGNARAWKAAAQAQSTPVATLRTWMDDAATQYLLRLQWVDDLRANTALAQKLMQVASALGMVDQDFLDIVQPLRVVATNLGGATKNNYAQIVTICDAILAEVEMPASLWQE